MDEIIMPAYIEKEAYESVYVWDEVLKDEYMEVITGQEPNAVLELA